MIYVLLPAYNEASALPLLLQDIRRVQWPEGEAYAVVVVDDGSTDSTLAACRACWGDMPLEVICHGRNLGLGAAMMTGLKHCISRSQEGDAIVAMDADNTHSPLLIPKMVCALQSGSDIVIGSRYADGGGQIGLRPTRRILSRCASAALKVAFPIPGARDYTSGYRAYSAAIIERGFGAYSDKLIEQKGFACMAELLIKLRAIGARVSEVPLVLRYDRKPGSSKMKVAGTIASYLKLMAINRPRVRQWGIKSGKRGQ
jgi:dolichol-phosphate mannosyltransferase